MGSREEILANFQACTGIEDVEMAIFHLEQANWSLLDAVNKAMSESPAPPPAAPLLPSSSSSSSSSGGLAGAVAAEGSLDSGSPLVSTPTEPMDVGSVPSRLASSVSLADDFYQVPSTSSQRTRMLEFNVQFNDRMFHFKVPDNEDVKTLKTLIHGETGVPACGQNLLGLIKSNNAPFPMSDRRKLSELNLPRENFLYLASDADLDREQNNGPSDDKEPSDFKLTILDETNAKTYTLNYPPTKTVLSIKMDVSDMTNVAVSKQRWQGWPPNISDEVSLAQTGLPRIHTLSFTAEASASAPSMPIIDQTLSHDRKESESDLEESQPDDYFDEDLFSSGSLSTRRGNFHPLIPDDFGDDVMAAIRFEEEFTNRYGQPHPRFFPGTLEQAIKESCLKPAKERKMLAVYLHHDSSVLTNVFCTQVLCSESVSSFLDENFVSFGWDLTFYTNKNRAVQFINNHFGSVASSSIKHMDVEKFPIIALVYRLRGTLEIFQMIHGNVTLDELISRLLSAVETYQSQLAVEIREDEERIARDAVKREQDLAYEMSLVADREKEAQKQRQEAERLKKEQLEAEARRKEEEEKAAIDRQKQQVRNRLRQTLPLEPEKDDARKMAQLRFRVPTTLVQTGSPINELNAHTPGDSSKQWLERRFLASDLLQTVLDYLTVEGYPSDEYKVLSSWPRRDLTQVDPKRTLEELKLCPQETLTLEDKH